ncbi:hypothetical protein A2392_01200 [Candidatus Kaiserbacteria bacterium RIFOXYB1_FULL_46_14]|uniref:Uncharacterized protein n=1 Tax=Candidatus Kaiserbacteria bacterium RIFOXYB1_FULL_46_14 TaxID=1798531 RepID=A0A1F6FJM5_9BACT|nr:MAG: hypothetical protein A2392_01200 [Candidatus Kaiserbacteria bacterium RIFOXYB1_FULL_46_14]
MQTNHLGTTFGVVLLFTLVSAFLIRMFFGFEIALLSTICLGTAFILAGIVGLENIIKMSSHKGTKYISPDER